MQRIKDFGYSSAVIWGIISNDGNLKRKQVLCLVNNVRGFGLLKFSLYYVGFFNITWSHYGSEEYVMLCQVTVEVENADFVIDGYKLICGEIHTLG